MSLSILTLALARKYTDSQIVETTGKIDEQISDAIKESKAYTDKRFGEITSFSVKIVETLPLSDIDTHTIYFVKRLTPSGEVDFYYEYMYIDNHWELIGSTELSLDDYWTIEEVKEYVESQKYTLPIASQNTLGGVKVDNYSISVTNEGVISVMDTYTKSIAKDVAAQLIEDDFTTIEESEIDQLFQ